LLEVLKKIKVMDKRQRQLILKLAEKLKKEKKSRSKSTKILESAGIIPLKGKNPNYPNLDKALKTA